MTGKIDLENKDGYTLRGLDHINILLGKNGCGKSTVLKKVEQVVAGDTTFGITRYLTPERCGFLQYEANIENNILTNQNWLSDSRRVNQFQSFKQQSVANFRRLETLILRKIEKIQALRANPAYSFDLVITAINGLLDNVEMRREGATFLLYTKGTDNRVFPQLISSGESELISLAIECLMFEEECIEGKTNLLFLDEPDVHLHPDLQAQFGRFLRNELKNCKVVIATHSTAFLGAFTDYENIAIAFMKKGDKEFVFEEVSDVYRKVLPVFGAHPLSNLFNEAPVFLVEGEDDERIWQQAVRTSCGKLKIYPCSVNSISELNGYETEVQKILNAVYDKPKAYSCRDGDGISDPINDLPPVTRFRLNCKAAENLLVTNEVLASLNINWDTLKQKIEDWLTKNQSHPHFSNMEAFKIAGFPRKSFDLKEIRNDLMGIIGSSKSWEIAVGRVIANLERKAEVVGDSLQDYLGNKLVGALFN